MTVHLPFEIRKQKIDAFNERQSSIKRSRPYIPLEIDENTDTESAEWLFHCLILHILNLPTRDDRERQLSLIKQKSPAMYEKLMVELPKKELEILHTEERFQEH